MEFPPPHADDFELAQRCLEGERRARVHFDAAFRPFVLGYLRKHKVEGAEADLVANCLWDDLFVDRGSHRPRLTTYDGQSALQSWLGALALKWLDGNPDGPGDR